MSDEFAPWRKAHEVFCLQAGYKFTEGSTDCSTRARIAGLQAAQPYMPPLTDMAVPMILTCPSCSGRHIDEGDFAEKLHHTHACQHCGMTWRPAIVPTVGVQFLPGFKNEEAK